MSDGEGGGDEEAEDEKVPPRARPATAAAAVQEAKPCREHADNNRVAANILRSSVFRPAKKKKSKIDPVFHPRLLLSLNVQ